MTLRIAAASEMEDALANIERLAPVVAVLTGNAGSHSAGLQVAETASDVLACGRAVLDAHEAAVDVFDEARSRPPMFTFEETDAWSQTPAQDRLRKELKAWLFFLRAFFDTTYRVLNANATGERARASGSMSSILGPKGATNPAGQLLEGSLPGFHEWFTRFKDLRDEVKRGVLCSFTHLDEHGLYFTVYEFRASKAGTFEVEQLTGMTLTDVAVSARCAADVLATAAATAPPSARATPE